MKKKKILFICIFFLCLLLAFVWAFSYGNQVKKSFKDNVEFDHYLNKYGKNLRVMNGAYPYDKEYDLYGADEAIKKQEDLDKKSDVIVRVKLVSNFKRKIYEECILSKVKIIKNYKGDRKKGEEISVFEPVNCTGMGNPMLCWEGYTPMQQGEEYLLFLKSIKDSHFGNGRYIYLPVSLTYAKYRADYGFPKLCSAKQIGEKSKIEDRKIKYVDIKDQEVLICDKEIYKNYINYKKYVILKYKK